MMYQSAKNISRGTWWRSLALTLLGAVTVLFTGVGLVGTASAAENVNFSFDEGTIQLSDTWAKIIDQELTPPDSPATLAATVAANGDLSAPATSFSFPSKTISGLETGNSLLPVVDAKIQIKANAQITGNFDGVTGASSLSIPTLATITVYSAGSPASVAKCNVSGFSLDLVTTGQLDDPGDLGATPPRPAHTYEAALFAPPAGDGAMVTTWAGLPNAVDAGGSLGSIVCPALDDMIGGAGGLWLSGSAVEGEAPAGNAPTIAPKITTTPVSMTEEISAEFAFEAGEDETEPVTGFQCALDAGAFAACDTGTVSYTALTVGNHAFQVKATNIDGDGPSATYSWEVTEKVIPPPPGKPKLGGLKIKPKNRAVKRGKNAVIKVRVKNVGKARANGVRVCVKAPKRFVKVRKCVKIGKLNAKRAGVAKFRVKVKRKARRGKRVVLKFRAIGKNVKTKRGKAKIRVK